MKNIGRIIKCTAAAAVCALTFSGCENYNKMMDETPYEYVNLAAENTSEAMVKSAFAQEAAIIEKAAKDGTAGFSFSYDDISVSSDNYANEADKKASGTMNIGMGGENVEVYYAVDGDVFKLGEKGKSGENIVEINTKTLKEDFAASIFAPGSGSAVEISQEDYDSVIKALDEIVVAVEGGEETPEEYAEIEKLVKEMMNEAAVEKKADVTIDETEVKANILTYNFDKADVEKIVDAYTKAMAKEMAELGEEADTAELEAEMNEAMNAISKLDITLVYYVNSKTHSLMQTHFTVDTAITEDEETQNIKADVVTSYGVDPAESNEVTVDIEMEANGEKISADIVSERKSENETEVKISASMQGMSMDIAVLNFKRDGESYTISAEIPVAQAKATIAGTLKTDSKSVEATVDTVAYEMATEEIEGNVEGLNIKGYIKQGGTFDSREAKNLFKLTEDELKALVEAVGNDFGALAGETSVGGAMTSYIDKSKQSSANANAKSVYVAFSAALTEAGIQGAEIDDYELYNETAGDYSAVTSNGYQLNVSEYLGADFTGYYYVSFDPSTYAVDYALWSEEPIEYTYQYNDFDQEMLAEEGEYVGCYPLAEE